MALEKALEWVEAGESAAVATVIDTWGSAPRRVGAQMAVSGSGQIAGFDPFVIDPREAFASADRFPDTQLLHDWPDQAVGKIGLDARTAVVLLTHDPKLDDPALHLALRSDAFYIGALGSKRTHAARVERLRQAGFNEAEIARIAAPVGLDIGSANPAEIAVSILGQMVERLRKPLD